MVLGLFSTTASPVIRPLMFAGPIVRSGSASSNFASSPSAAAGGAAKNRENKQQKPHAAADGVRTCIGAFLLLSWPVLSSGGCSPAFAACGLAIPAVRDSAYR